MSDPDIDYMFKIVIIGDVSVGKSNIISRYVRDVFVSNNQTTIGLEYSNKIIIKNNKVIRLQMFDTNGQERFKAITHAYYRGAVCVLLVYDVSNYRTFTNLDIWLNEIKDYAPDNCLVVLIGNKIDNVTHRQVPEKIAKQFAEDHGLVFFEVSAFDGSGVNDMFEFVLDSLIIDKHTDCSSYEKKNVVAFSDKIKSKKCCE